MIDAISYIWHDVQTADLLSVLHKLPQPNGENYLSLMSMCECRYASGDKVGVMAAETAMPECC